MALFSHQPPELRKSHSKALEQIRPEFFWHVPGVGGLDWQIATPKAISSCRKHFNAGNPGSINRKFIHTTTFRLYRGKSRIAALDENSKNDSSKYYDPGLPG
jgi:hypothetical protein